MTMLATLIGDDEPRRVRLVITGVAAGESWAVTGRSDDTTWTVPGGAGIGDGEQILLVDVGTPTNTPVEYTLRKTSATEVTTITVPSNAPFVLQSLDGQIVVPVELLTGSLDIVLPSNAEVFTIPGRPRPVVRYSAMGDSSGAFRIRVSNAQAPAFRKLMAEGGPIFYRATPPLEDLAPVGVIQVGTLSGRALELLPKREWSIPYVVIDNPKGDVRIGAFSWDYIDALQIVGTTVIRSGATMEAIMAGLTWDEIDRFDWSVLE